MLYYLNFVFLLFIYFNFTLNHPKLHNFMRKFLHFLFFLAFLGTGSLTVHAEDLTPEIIFPKPGQECILYNVSANGHWATHGSNIVDLTVTPFEFRNIGGSVRAVSDDGKTAVGSNGGPAVWKEGKGWQRLPLPQGTRGGSAVKMTPDGKYAVGTANLGVVNSSEGIMWELETLQMIELPNRPTEDRAAHGPFPNAYQNQYDNISPDGRYVQGTLGWSYLGEQITYVYDRETDETRFIGFNRNADGTYTAKDPNIHYVECEGMSADGHYLTGPIYLLSGNEYLAAYRYDVWNDELEYYNIDDQPDAWAFSVSNDGLVFLRKEAHNPYSEGYVCYNNFFYAFRDILGVGYGINLEKYGIDNTGVPVSCSADGRTIIFINSPSTSYVVKLKEDLKEICDKLPLLSNWTSTPQDGCVMSKLSAISINFDYPIQTSPTNYTRIQLLDSDGNFMANPLVQNGVSAEKNSLKLVFRTVTLEEGKEYTLKIPAGVCNVKNLPNNVNDEITLRFVGRKEGPVAVTRIYPEEGASLSSLSLQNDPVLITFDSDLNLNTEMEDPIMVYIDDNPTPVAYLYAGLYNPKTLALFPPYEQPLYYGSVYTIKVPAGLVTDVSGYGGNELFEITYNGNFLPHFGSDKYLFRSTCDNWDNFLFFEGDHGTPTSEYAGMGFTADTTPWWVVMDNESSTDMAFASHSSYTDGRQANDWVMTRQIFIPDETVSLEFDGQSYRRNKEDILKIYVYCSDMLINSLTEQTVEQIQKDGDLVFEERLNPGATEGGIDDEWTHYEVPLDKYSGKNIYIAFVNQNQNQSLVMIDNVEVLRHIDSYISLSTPSNVVNMEDLEIKGMLIVENPTADYNSVELRLKDADGNIISTVKDNGLSLKADDTYQFAFPQNLPLIVGEDNKFTIEFDLDDHQDTYVGSVKDLTFEPVKRVVLEEFTGRDCQFCPQGLVMIEHLSNEFKDCFIPVALYCYMGTDPKGLGVMDYFNYLGMSAAPSARVNRRDVTMSMTYISPLDKYIYSVTQYPQEVLEPMWYDEVVTELSEPAFLDISVSPQTGNNDSRLHYTANIKSAIHLENQNIRVFGVLLENGLKDYQVNAMYNRTDPIFGEWGQGGSLGSNIAQTTFNHAAKATWGRGFNGTGNLIPAALYPSDTYSVDIDMDIPESVDNIENCEFVVMLIDGNTGRIINAAVASDASGIKGLASDAPDSVSITAHNGEIQILSKEYVDVQVWSAAGMLLASDSGNGPRSITLNGYRGMVIVNVATPRGSLVRKLLL